MTDKKNNPKDQQPKEELNLEDLKNVQGGSIRDVKYTETTVISDDTKKKI